MKFLIIIHKTALHHAIEKENVEIVKILLDVNNIDINIVAIINLFFFNKILYFLFLIQFYANY